FMISTRLEYKIEDTKDGFKILRINKDNKWIYIGSKYNMKLEIEKFLKDLDEFEVDEKKSIIIVFGFGTGEHIKVLREKYKNNEIIVFEPNINLKEYINEFKCLNKDDKIKIFCDESIDVKEIVKSKINQFNLFHSKFIYFSNYYKIYKLEMEEFLLELKKIFYNLKLDLNTAIYTSESGFLSLLENIKYMLEGVPADIYENEYKNKPAVIVSAGPSLEKNIDCLKEINNDMIIFTGGRTLRTLIDKNIKPHLLGVVDPNEVSYKLCEGYLENSNVPLLFFEETNSKVVKNHKGEKIFFTYNNAIAKISGVEMKPLLTGGSVAHILLSYAIMLGCSPIIFVGQDLAYTGEKSHAEIADNRDNVNWFEKLKAEDDIYVDDINGKKVRTSLTLNKYRETIEEIIADNSDRKFINATEGGSRIKGTIEMPLKEAITKYKEQSFNIFEEKEYNVDIKKNVIKALEKTKKDCNDIIRSYKEGLYLIEKLKKYSKLKNTSYVNEILNKLNVIDDKAQRKYENMELIKSLIYPIIYEILSQRTIDTSDKKNELYIYKENERFYTELIEKLKYAEDNIEITLNKLR
ncbi:motility associated factor glycosyltransferase family protein, partial [Clostridium neonatale]